MNIIIIVIFYIIQKIIKKPVIGGGDLKLFLGIGLFMGWQLEMLGLLIACIIGAFVEIIFSKKLNRKVLPFGPYLVIGFTISLFFGPDLICGIYICFNKGRKKCQNLNLKPKI